MSAPHPREMREDGAPEKPLCFGAVMMMRRVRRWFDAARGRNDGGHFANHSQDELLVIVGEAR